MPVIPNENDIVYIFVRSSGIAEQCKVVAKDFGNDGTYLLHGMNSKDDFVANVEDMYASVTECLQETAKKQKDAYDAYYNTYDSMEILMLHLLYSAIESGRHDDFELNAMINRASEFIGVDMMPSVEKYVKSMKKEKKVTVDL